MEKYISVVETAERWNVSPRRIQILCNENRIKGAKKQSGIWFIPYGAKKPERIKSGVKNEENKVLNVLSLFSGCGGMDLGFEGGFDVLAKSVNMHMHKDWKIKKSKDGWVRLPKNKFHTVFANDIKLEIVVPGQYYFRNGSHYLRYEEVMEDFAEPTVNYIKISRKGMEVRKKGVVNVHMVFEQGKKNMTYYTTPYGTIEMGIAATNLNLQESDGGLDMKVDYALDMNQEHVADCYLAIKAQPKDCKNFTI